MDVQLLNRVAVMGGAGFLGSHLCERLVHNGTEVICMDDFTTGTPENIAHLCTRSNFRFRYHDVLEPLQMNSPLDAVIHLTGPESLTSSTQSTLQALRVACFGSSNMLDLAARTDARLVVAHSTDRSGSAHSGRPCSSRAEHQRTAQFPACDVGQRFGDALVAASARERDMSAGIVRVFETYGPRMQIGSTKLVPTLICKALAGETIVVKDTCHEAQPFCYVDDVVEGLLAVASSGQPGPFDLGSTDQESVLHLARTIVDLSGSRSDIEVAHVPDPDPGQATSDTFAATVGDNCTRSPDFSTVQRLLGWKPKIDLESGLETTIRWFAGAGAHTVCGDRGSMRSSAHRRRTVQR